MKYQIPYAVLGHGNVLKFRESIKEEVLLKESRQHVHLSLDIETAKKVGSRRGKPIILEVNAEEMTKSGYELFLSDNGVRLTDYLSAKLINFNLS